MLARTLILGVLITALWGAPSKAGVIDRRRLIQYAYLASAPYFYTQPFQASNLLPRQKDALSQLISDPSISSRPRLDTSPALAILPTTPARVIALIQPDPGPPHPTSAPDPAKNANGAEVVFSIRGSASLSDYQANLSALALYGKHRLRQGFQFNRKTLQGVTSSNRLEEWFELLPDLTPAQPPELGLNPSLAYGPSNAGEAILRRQLLANYVKPIGVSVNEFLISPQLRATLKRMQLTHVQRVVFVGHSLGGLLARITALNYSNTIAGFTQARMELGLPETAESIGFSSPGLNRRDYKRLFHFIVTQPETYPNPRPWIESHHLTVGHEQDLILAMGNVRPKSGGTSVELALEPDGNSLIIQLPQAWFDALDDSPGSHFALERTLGLSPKNWIPHSLFELIDSIEELESAHLPLVVNTYDESRDEASPPPPHSVSKS